MEINQAFGDTLRKVRKERLLSQEKLAEMGGLHRTYISQLERGVKSPSLVTVFRLAVALKVEPHELIAQVELALMENAR